MEHAKKRGAKIYCELSGYGMSADAHHITAPTVDGPKRSMLAAIKNAEINNRLNPINSAPILSAISIEYKIAVATPAHSNNFWRSIFWPYVACAQSWL